jgi:hypothetical protein
VEQVELLKFSAEALERLAVSIAKTAVDLGIDGIWRLVTSQIALD